MHKDSEGYTAVKLLERLMEKDQAERIGLDQVKVRFLNRPFWGANLTCEMVSVALGMGSP